jgi:hypothetical protein
METITTKTKINSKFNLIEKKQIREYLSEFFFFNEELNYRILDKSFLNNFKKKYDIKWIKLIKKRDDIQIKVSEYVKNGTNLQLLENLFHKILENEKEINFDDLIMYSKFILCSQKHNPSGRILISNLTENFKFQKLFSCLKEYSYKANFIHLNSFNAPQEICNNAIKNMLCEGMLIQNILSLSITLVQLNKDSLETISNFIKKCKCLDYLDLSNTQIGKCENSLELLKLTSDISTVILSNNEYGHTPELIEYLNSKKKGIIKLRANQFTIQDIIFFASNLKLSSIVHFDCSFESSPTYRFINDNIELHYTTPNIIENFDKYISSLNFRSFVVNKGTTNDKDLITYPRILILPQVNYFEFHYYSSGHKLITTLLPSLENKNLEKINLIKEIKTDKLEVFSQFIRKLMFCPHVKELQIKTNITENEYNELLELLQKNNLKYLEIISDSFLSENQMSRLYEVLQKNSSLETLILEKLKIDQEVEKKFVDDLQIEYSKILKILEISGKTYTFN